MSDTAELNKSIESCKRAVDRYDQCGNDVAVFQSRRLADWLEELRQKREILSDLRDKLDGVDVISKRDIMRIIGV